MKRALRSRRGKKKWSLCIGARRRDAAWRRRRNQCLPFFHWTGKSPIQPIFTGLYWEWEQRSRTGHWGENGKIFKYWMAIQPSAASAKKFRKLSRSPIWGFYSAEVVYNAGIDRDICLIDIGSGLIRHKAFRHSFISSQHRFVTTFHFWKLLICNWTQTRMNMVACESERFRQQLLFRKSATSQIEDYLCDSLSGGTFQC